MHLGIDPRQADQMLRGAISLPKGLGKSRRVIAFCEGADADAAKEAGKLLESLQMLWEEANLTERRTLLMTMLDGVYVDTVEEKSIVAIRPKPAFQALFEIATTRDGSGVVLINEPPPTDFEPEAAGSCLWWRRGRVVCSLFDNAVGSPFVGPVLK